MNLIEQLGGYEKALDLFRGCPWDSGTVDVPNPRSKGMLRLDLNDLGYELLEYRRQHNIFDVGDCVVKTNPKIKHAHVRVVISTSPSGGAVLDYQGFPYKSPCVRHATDEEIAAGRRLPVIESDDCSDIRNHISPNTVVIDHAP